MTLVAFIWVPIALYCVVLWNRKLRRVGKIIKNIEDLNTLQTGRITTYELRGRQAPKVDLINADRNLEIPLTSGTALELHLLSMGVQEKSKKIPLADKSVDDAWEKFKP